MDWKCSIFSWEIQYTFVLMGDPLIKLRLSPSGQTICNVKCVRLYYKSPTCSASQILCKGWPPILSHKANLFIYKLGSTRQYRVFCSISLVAPGFYDNSWPVLVCKLAGWWMVG